MRTARERLFPGTYMKRLVCPKRKPDESLSMKLQKPREINKPLVDAQQARRVLDRLVGFELSPVLWKKVRPSLSAGRVQSVAVRLIVEREKEIMNFLSESYFRVAGSFLKGKESIKAEVSKHFGSDTEVEGFLTE